MKLWSNAGLILVSYVTFKLLTVLRKFLILIHHFNRKICRNCKCGLEDHDVQLQTEENQKVGRLFEDTKYTSLIAKLNKDGVPSYQGSQLTITISTPAVGTAVPVAVAGTAGTVSPVYSHGVPGHGAPSVPGHGTPSVPAHGAPSVPHKGAPSAAGQGFPSVPGQGAPSVPHKGAPSAAGQGFPSAPGGSFAAGRGIPSAAPVAAAVTPAAMAAKKDVVKAVTYEWAPPGVNQKLVRIPAQLCLFHTFII